MLRYLKLVKEIRRQSSDVYQGTVILKSRIKILLKTNDTEASNSQTN